MNEINTARVERTGAGACSASMRCPICGAADCTGNECEVPADDSDDCEAPDGMHYGGPEFDDAQYNVL